VSKRETGQPGPTRLIEERICPIYEAQKHQRGVLPDWSLCIDQYELTVAADSLEVTVRIRD